MFVLSYDATNQSRNHEIHRSSNSRTANVCCTWKTGRVCPWEETCFLGAWHHGLRQGSAVWAHTSRPLHSRGSTSPVHHLPRAKRLGKVAFPRKGRIWASGKSGCNPPVHPVWKQRQVLQWPCSWSFFNFVDSFQYSPPWTNTVSPQKVLTLPKIGTYPEISGSYKDSCAFGASGILKASKCLKLCWQVAPLGTCFSSNSSTALTVARAMVTMVPSWAPQELHGSWTDLKIWKGDPRWFYCWDSDGCWFSLLPAEVKVMVLGSGGTEMQTNAFR